LGKIKGKDFFYKSFAFYFAINNANVSDRMRIISTSIAKTLLMPKAIVRLIKIISGK
jgi:hypothetical protein